MPRCKKTRFCGRFEGIELFKPAGVPMSEIEIVSLGMDELEVLRLCDFNGLTQEEAGEKIGVSRGTIQRLTKSGRKKIIGCILGQKALVINKSGEHIQDLNEKKGE